jgi:hypothetical protein
MRYELNSHKTLILAVVFLSSLPCVANATMRCGSALISNGEMAQSVRAKCGAPDKEQTEGPARRSNGVPKLNAAQISIWTYGPHNGASQYLRFIDDKLVSVETRRD